MRVEDICKQLMKVHMALNNCKDKYFIPNDLLEVIDDYMLYLEGMLEERRQDYQGDFNSTVQELK